MSRIPSLLFCALALAFPIAAQREPAPKRARGAKTPTIAFCKLIEQPRLYDNRVVRTEAISAVGMESQVLYDPRCSTAETRTWVVSAASVGESNREVSKVYYALLFDKENNRYPVGRSGRARAMLVGRFEASDKNGYGHLNQYRFQFVIMRIEKAERVADDVPYWP